MYNEVFLQRGAILATLFYREELRFVQKVSTVVHRGFCENLYIRQREVIWKAWGERKNKMTEEQHRKENKCKTAGHIVGVVKVIHHLIPLLC